MSPEPGAQAAHAVGSILWTRRGPTHTAQPPGEGQAHTLPTTALLLCRLPGGGSSATEKEITNQCEHFTCGLLLPPPLLGTRLLLFCLEHRRLCSEDHVPLSQVPPCSNLKLYGGQRRQSRVTTWALGALALSAVEGGCLGRHSPRPPPSDP